MFVASRRRDGSTVTVLIYEEGTENRLRKRPKDEASTPCSLLIAVSASSN